MEDLTKEYIASLDMPQLIKLEKELAKEVKDLKNKVDDKSAKEQAYKLYMNSTYGAWAARGNSMRSQPLSETITMEGRKVIQYVMGKHEEYWYEQWHLDTELHRALGINGEVKQIPRGKPVVIYGDTDSVDKDAYIYVNGHKIKIKDFFLHVDLEGVIKLKNDKEVIPLKGYDTYCYDNKSGKLKLSPIKNIMRHKTKKKLYKVKMSDGSYVKCTADHNLMVVRNGNILNLTPTQIEKGDKVLKMK